MFSMKAQIVSYRRGRHTQYNNHMLLKIKDIDSKEKAEKFIGKEVEWTSSGGKKIKGRISSVHGNNGVLRAIFEKGMPGQSINTFVEILE